MPSTRPGLLIGAEQLAVMRRGFADRRWPDFDERFMAQPAPHDLTRYRVWRYDGKAWAWAETHDAKFARWVVTENSVAFALGGDRKHLAATTAWVEAIIRTPPRPFDAAQRTDLFYANIAVAVSLFLDLCSDQADPELCERARVALLAHSEQAWAYISSRPRDQHHYTQNHFYLPLTGLICASLTLRSTEDQAAKWLSELAVYPPMIFRSLGRDGFYYEGLDYFNYAFMGLVLLAELSRRHFGQDYSGLPCFTKAIDFVHWMHYPRGREYFRIGDGSAKDVSFACWDEREQWRDIGPDGKANNFLHLLCWIGYCRAEGRYHQVAEAMHRRGYTWREGFWALAWATDAPVEDQPASTHLFDDHGVWAGEATAGEHTLRVLAKCGPPLGHAMPMIDGQPAYAYNAGHTHPDAGSLLVAFDDMGIVLGPGYLGRKSGTHLNTYTFDGTGQQDDRLYHALDADAINYDRLRQLRCTPLTGAQPAVEMDFTAAYAEALGVRQAVRRVTLIDAFTLRVDDMLVTATPRRPEMRLRIAEAPQACTATGIDWQVGSVRCALRVTESSTPLTAFCWPGEVITINDDGKSGPLEAGAINQRGYQIMLRPQRPVTQLRISFELRLHMYAQAQGKGSHS